MKKTVIVSILWLLLGAAIFYAALMFNLFLNMFSWRLKLGAPVYILIAVMLILIVAGFILAKHTNGKFEIWLSFIVALLLMGFGAFVLYVTYNETISTMFLGRSKLSPHWFRITSFIFYSMAMLSWFVFPYKRLRAM